MPVDAGLHLKSSVNDLGDGRLIIVTPALEGRSAFRGFRRIVLDPEDAYAANVLRLNGRLLLPAGFPVRPAEARRTGLAAPRNRRQRSAQDGRRTDLHVPSFLNGADRAAIAFHARHA